MSDVQAAAYRTPGFRLSPPRAKSELQLGHETSWKGVIVPCTLTFTALVYGGWAVVGKALLSSHPINPLVLAFYRSLGGGLVLWAAHLGLSAMLGTPMSLNGVLQTPRRDVLRLAALGVFVAMNSGGNILAIKFLPALTVATFQPLLPVFAGTVSVFLGIERYSLLKLCGVVLAVAGAVLVVILNPNGHSSPSAESSAAKGVPCLVVNIAGGSLYMVLQKGMLQTYPPVATAASAFLSSALVLFVAAACTAGADPEVWRLGGHLEAVLALCYAIFLVTALNYSLLAWANRESTPTTVTCFQTLQPVFAAVLAWLCLRERLTPGIVGGGAAIMAGLMCFLRSRSVDEEEADEAMAFVESLAPEKIGTSRAK